PRPVGSRRRAHASWEYGGPETAPPAGGSARESPAEAPVARAASRDGAPRTAPAGARAGAATGRGSGARRARGRAPGRPREDPARGHHARRASSGTRAATVQPGCQLTATQGAAPWRQSAFPADPARQSLPSLVAGGTGGDTLSVGACATTRSPASSAT